MPVTPINALRTPAITKTAITAKVSRRIAEDENQDLHDGGSQNHDAAGGRSAPKSPEAMSSRRVQLALINLKRGG